MQDKELDDALSESALWPLDGELVTPPVEIKGGLTNRSYLLQTDQSKYRLRLNTPIAAALGIDREREEKIIHQVHTAGIGPKLLFGSTDFRYSLFEFVEGRPWTAEDIQDEQQVARLESVIAQFQNLRIDSTPRDYRVYLNHYWQQLKESNCLNADETERYLEFDALLEKQTQTWPEFVLCHHDLTPENIIETTKGLTIIDWEYAALGHPDLDAYSLGSYKDPGKSKVNIDTALEELIFWLNRLWSDVSKHLLKNQPK